MSSPYFKPPAHCTFTKIYHNTPYPAISPTRPENIIHGEVVVITGGGTGIGAGIAKTFAEAGAAGALTSISNTAKVEYTVADITDEGALVVAFARLVKSLGKIDVLVSNAGFMSEMASLDASDGAYWWKAFEINVKGGFNTIPAFVPHAAPNATVSSTNAEIAHMRPFPVMSSCITSKSASGKIFESLQIEYPELRVVNVMPGMVESNMTKKVGVAGLDDPALVGGFMVWLSGPEAGFLKGKSVWANWDVDELNQRAAEIDKPEILELSLLGTGTGKG